MAMDNPIDNQKNFDTTLKIGDIAKKKYQNDTKKLVKSTPKLHWQDQELIMIITGFLDIIYPAISHVRECMTVEYLFNTEC